MKLFLNSEIYWQPYKNVTVLSIFQNTPVEGWSLDA